MRRETLFTLLIVLGFLYLFLLQIQAIWPFTIDDMYISLRYAKHWVLGEGLVWNVNEPPVEGYSNFLFVVLGMLSLWVGVDPVTTLKITGVVGLFLTGIAIYTISRFWFKPFLALIPVFWLLLYKGQIIWAVSGLETTVFQALLAFTVFFIYRGLGYRFFPAPKENSSLRSWFLAGVLLGILGLTRPEAPALMLLFLFLAWFTCESKSITHRQGYFVFAAVLALLFVPYFVWRWNYYGRLFPNPVYCKGFVQGMAFKLDKDYLNLIWPFTLLSIPVVFQTLDRRHYFLWLPSLLYLILLWNADPVVAFDNRLFLPAFALLLPLALQGLYRFFFWYWPIKDTFGNVIFYAVALILGFFFIPSFSLSAYRQFSFNPQSGEYLRERVATWLENNSKKKDRVVLADAGLIPYKSNRFFIDSYCLNNAEMTKENISYPYQWFCEHILVIQPEVIILTSLSKNGRIIYTPSDACLAPYLFLSNDYCLQTRFQSGTKGSQYRYEIFTKKNSSCSKMPDTFR